MTLDIHPRGMSNFRLLVMLEELVDFFRTLAGSLDVCVCVSWILL
jgi:hypothetical protein